MAKKKLDKAKVEALFDKHDFNKDGTIDYTEIKPMLKALGYTEAVIEGCSLDVNFIAQGDQDGDCKLNKTEFMDLLKIVNGEKPAKKK